MLSHQRELLFLLTYGLLLAIRIGSAQVLTGDCDFDRRTLCNWENEKSLDHFDWLVSQGSNTSQGAGSTSNQSGNGSYMYIETSLPRQYDEKARLLSPWMKGPKWMTFLYSMNGTTIESLSVYARINGSDYKIWSQDGNLSTSNWTRGCVAINHYGIYQVIIEGVAGLSITADIAVDDIGFSNNMTCGSLEKNIPSHMFGENCTFGKNFCGWRNILSPWDHFDWSMRKTGTPSQRTTGPCTEHTGGAKYIYIVASNPRKENETAKLLSPLLRPRSLRCFRFCYHMYGSYVGSLDVSLQKQEAQINQAVLLWTMKGQQGDRWRKTSIDIGYTGGEYQGTVISIPTSVYGATIISLHGSDSEDQAGTMHQGSVISMVTFVYGASGLSIPGSDSEDQAGTIHQSLYLDDKEYFPTPQPNSGLQVLNRQMAILSNGRISPVRFQ